MLTFRIGFNSFRREMPHTLEGLSIAVHHCRFIGWSIPETARMAGPAHLHDPCRSPAHVVLTASPQAQRGQPRPVSQKCVVSKE
jgi:hypothetical protein